MIGVQRDLQHGSKNGTHHVTLIYENKTKTCVTPQLLNFEPSFRKDEDVKLSFRRHLIPSRLEGLVLPEEAQQGFQEAIRLGSACGSLREEAIAGAVARDGGTGTQV